MSEARIGRVLVASLHQAIADLLPTRLEFYENWLNVSGLREGTIGLAPLLAVLSFLRTEGDAYALVTTRAGEYAADWTVSGMMPLRRKLIRVLPVSLRTRAALRTARQLIRDTYPGSRAIVRLKRGTASVDLRGSLFCEVRETSGHALCGFYVAAIARTFQRYELAADARVNQCRAAGASRGCLLSVVVGTAPASESVVA
jgi:hypothetical protein